MHGAKFIDFLAGIYDVRLHLKHDGRMRKRQLALRSVRAVCVECGEPRWPCLEIHWKWDAPKSRKERDDDLHTEILCANCRTVRQTYGEIRAAADKALTEYKND